MPQSQSTRTDACRPARRALLATFVAILLAAAIAACDAGPPTDTRLPNIVLILADDLGYGDLSIQGHPLIRTPNIDRIASEGQRWTSFYASAPMCNPSRVALLTGRMPIRIHRNGKNLWADLPDDEVTMAEMLKQRGYGTAYVGKWGLSRRFNYQGSHPNDQGFDAFFGLVGSNDAPLREGFERTYGNIKNATSADFPISLYRQKEAVETPAYQPTLTKRYTEEAVRWIGEQADQPFMLFIGHSMPHVPIFRSPGFEGHSDAGLYGDVIEELDWSVGEVVSALERAGVAEDTLIWFSSDKRSLANVLRPRRLARRAAGRKTHRLGRRTARAGYLLLARDDPARRGRRDRRQRRLDGHGRHVDGRKPPRREGVRLDRSVGHSAAGRAEPAARVVLLWPARQSVGGPRGRIQAGLGVLGLSGYRENRSAGEATPTTRSTARRSCSISAPISARDGMSPTTIRTWWRKSKRPSNGSGN